MVTMTLTVTSLPKQDDPEPRGQLLFQIFIFAGSDFGLHKDFYYYGIAFEDKATLSTAPNKP